MATLSKKVLQAVGIMYVKILTCFERRKSGGEKVLSALDGDKQEIGDFFRGDPDVVKAENKIDLEQDIINGMKEKMELKKESKMKLSKDMDSVDKAKIILQNNQIDKDVENFRNKIRKRELDLNKTIRAAKRRPRDRRDTINETASMLAYELKAKFQPKLLSIADPTDKKMLGDQCYKIFRELADEKRIVPSLRTATFVAARDIAIHLFFIPSADEVYAHKLLFDSSLASRYNETTDRGGDPFRWFRPSYWTGSYWLDQYPSRK